LEAAMKRALLLLLVVAACGGSTRMEKDWDDLSDNQRQLTCDLYATHDSADFAGAAADLGWELGTMMRFLENHC
jgi:hypothetical protein